MQPAERRLEICSPDGVGLGGAEEPLMGEALARESPRDCELNEVIVGFNGDEDKATAFENRKAAAALIWALSWGAR